MDEGSSPWLYNMLAFDKFSYQLPSTFSGQAYSLITITHDTVFLPASSL
jgi:hypothetical protein